MRKMKSRRNINEKKNIYAYMSRRDQNQKRPFGTFNLFFNTTCLTSSHIVFKYQRRDGALRIFYFIFLHINVIYLFIYFFLYHTPKRLYFLRHLYFIFFIFSLEPFAFNRDGWSSRICLYNSAKSMLEDWLGINFHLEKRRIKRIFKKWEKENIKIFGYNLKWPSKINSSA